MNAAYGDGLLSEATFVHRLDLLFSGTVVEPGSIVGDISSRPAEHSWDGLFEAVRVATRHALAHIGAVREHHNEPPPLLLSLDWHGGVEEVILGRHPSCDVVLIEPSVSRRHAMLRFRDGKWVLRDLDSRNGILLNGALVKRCELRPGDVLELGGQRVKLD